MYAQPHRIQVRPGDQYVEQTLYGVTVKAEIHTSINTDESGPIVTIDVRRLAFKLNPRDVEPGSA